MDLLRNRLFCSHCKCPRDVTEFPFSFNYDRRTSCVFCKFRHQRDKSPGEHPTPETEKPEKYCTSCLRPQATRFRTCDACRTKKKDSSRRKHDCIARDIKKQRLQERIQYKEHVDTETAERLQYWQATRGEAELLRNKLARFNIAVYRQSRPLQPSDYWEIIPEAHLKQIWLQKQDNHRIRREALIRKRATRRSLAEKTRVDRLC
jgi:hypothetical protein